LARGGIELGIDYVSEAMGVVSGGVKRDFVFEGQLELSLDADLDTLIGWRGSTLHVSGLQVHGRGPSADLVGGNLMTVSDIEARRASRLYTLWFEQSLFEDRLAVQLGQLAADDEFMRSDTASNLVNGTFGWPVIASANMTQGGPAYPLPTPGVRLRIVPAEQLTVLAAAFSGNSAGAGCTDDAQICNKHGTTFSVSGGTLWLGELGYAAKLGPDRLPGSYKLGGWRETGTFPDQFTGTNDKRGNFGLYAVVDQMIWREPSSENQGLSLFLRAGWALEGSVRRPAGRHAGSWRCVWQRQQ
jgi:porin